MQPLSSSSADDRGKAAGWQARLPKLLLATFMLTVLTVGAFLVPSTAQARALPISMSTPTPTPTNQIKISRLTMIDQQHGWTISTNKHVFITSQGPEHWTDVTPSFLTQNPTSYITTAFFLNATHGYIGLLLGNNSFLLSTQDGGSTWQTTPLNIQAASDLPAIYQITFTDAQHGWLVIDKGQVQPGQFWVLLMSTIDGGKTWQTMVDTSQNPASLPTPYSLSAEFTFTNPLNGWVTGISLNGDVYLYSTHDGGKTWSKSNITPIKGGNNNYFTQSYGPFWQNSHSGTLFVQYDANTDNGISHLATYQTHDAGKTWILGPSSPISTIPLYSFLNAQEGWSFGFDTQGQYAIIHTSTGGLTWHTFQPTGLIPTQADTQVLISMQFINSTTGWLIIQDAQGNHDLFQTNTGGHNWRQLQPVIN